MYQLVCDLISRKASEGDCLRNVLILGVIHKIRKSLNWFVRHFQLHYNVPYRLSINYVLLKIVLFVILNCIKRCVLLVLNI